RDAVRRGGGAGDRQPGTAAGPPLPAEPDRAAARGDHPGVLRRLYLPRGGRAAGHRAAHDQDADAGRADPDARLSGGESRMTTEIHALAGAYALNAVNDVERMEF